MRVTRIAAIVGVAAVLAGLATGWALAQPGPRDRDAVLEAMHAHDDVDDRDLSVGTAEAPSDEATQGTQRTAQDWRAYRDYLADARGDEIRGTTLAGTPFPRAIVAGYAAGGHLPWWLGVDPDYWLSPSLDGYDGALRNARMPDEESTPVQAPIRT